MPRILLWLSSVVIAIAGVGTAIDGYVVSGVAYLGIAAVAFPPLWDRLSARGVRAPIWSRWMGAIAFLVVAGTFLPNVKPQLASQRANVADAAPARQSSSGPTRAEFAVGVIDSDYGLIVSGRTNLPRGLELLVSLERHGKTYAQDKATVGENGLFYAGPFTNGDHKIPFGHYNVNIDSGIAEIQRDDLKAVIGPDWSKFTGPLVQRAGYGIPGRVVVLDLPFTFASGAHPDYVAETVQPSGAALSEPSSQWVRSSIANRVRARSEAYYAHREDAFFACRTFIRRNLRDPDSADFLSEYAPELVTKPSEGEYSVLQKIRAANGFGGKTISIFRCDTHLSGDQWSLDNLKEQNLD